MWGSTALSLSSVWTLFLAASHVAATGSPVVQVDAALPTQSFFPQVRAVLYRITSCLTFRRASGFLV